MRRKALSGIMLTLLLIGMLMLTLNVQLIKASGTIYIRPDGSIDPPTAPIRRVGNVYTFTDDIHNKSIVIQIDDITLNGNGHLLQGPTTGYALPYGIYLSLRKNVKITNIIISNGFTYCILLDASSNCRIVNNNILGIDCQYGIKLSESSDNLLTDNTIMNTYTAIELEGSCYNTLSNNEIIDNTHAIWLSSTFVAPTTGNTLRNNVMTGNKFSFLVFSHFSVSGYINDVDTSNTVDGKPIYYWINRHDESIPLDAGCIVIVNSSRITVKDLRLRNTGIGVCIAYTRDSVIKNVKATINFMGIWLQKSDSNVITKTNFTDNDGPGIYLEKSNYNSLTDNFVYNSNSSGIWLEDCVYPGYTTLIGNTVLYSRGIYPQEWNGAGILVDDSAHCEVINNNVERNWYGIVVCATPAVDNQICENNIVMNDVGLFLGDARSNAIYHNNFIDNKMQVDTHWWPSDNTFDNGYPSGGNYWSDYNGVDIKKGPNQDQPRSDGIGDTSYIVYDNIRDYYPLMYPYGSPPPPTYTLTINAGANGATNPTPGTYTYSEGQNVSVQAIPDTGYILDYWGLDGANVGTANPISVTMNMDHTLHAVFTLAYTLAITTTAGGTTNPIPGTHTYVAGTVVTVTATPNTHHYFDHWELDGVNNTANPLSVTMNMDHALRAVFTRTKYTLDITATAGGTTDPASGTYTYSSGTTVSVTALPDTGCYLDRWELDSINIGISNPVNVRMNMNRTLHAVFKRLSPGHDVAIKGITSKTVVGQGYPLAIKTITMNVGSYTETFNVTVYVNETYIASQNVTLESGVFTTITLTWNTTAFVKGNYTISAYAEQVLGETNTTDNTLEDGWVIVAMVGDLSGPEGVPDGLVDIDDIVYVSVCFGSYPGHEKWNPNADITNDNLIDIDDVMIPALHFGETDP